MGHQVVIGIQINVVQAFKLAALFIYANAHVFILQLMAQQITK